MNNIVDLFRSLFGTYEPIQSVVSGSVENGDIVYAYSIDWTYLFHAVFVLIILYSITRLIGILLEKK